ncbi:MAG: glycosyltransferase family 4 protein [Leptolyngbyaceae cyanobacterium RU_5_1]|nr:glycosyltransferase family 4 protein [Leptolyngbyaceae cyanobacterium RU_5_1]
MRILHILNDICAAGNGIINVAVDLACLQAKSGHETAIASTGGEYETLLANYGVKHFYFDQRRHPINLVKATQRYRAMIQTFQPNIVHAHMMTGIVLAWGLRGRSRYSLVSTVHNEFQRNSILMGLADRVIAVSHAVANSMQQRGIPPQKLRVVRNGTLGSPRSQPVVNPVALHRPAIATVAGMYQRKGISELITAFNQVAAEFPTAHLYLVGDGPHRSQFAAQAQDSAACDRIHFEGFQLKPQRYLQSTDIFVLASHREPFGLVLSEAREVGCAVVASNVDGIPEALDDGKAGILVPPANPAALATAIAQLLRHSDQLNHWKNRAQQNLEWLSVTRVHEETLAVYFE